MPCCTKELVGRERECCPALEPLGLLLGWQQDGCQSFWNHRPALKLVQYERDWEEAPSFAAEVQRVQGAGLGQECPLTR